MDDKKDILDELEQAYKDTISSSPQNSGVGTSSSRLSDEKEKIKSFIDTINKTLSEKKGMVESKLAELKNLKSEIESGLEELKNLETKKSTFENELDKISKIEEQEKQIETEVSSMSL